MRTISRIAVSRRARARLAALVVVLLVTAGWSGVSAAQTPQASTTSGDPAIGVLFRTTAASAITADSQHGCSAGVLAITGNYVLTAAHCVQGTGSDLYFVPGYDGTSGPLAPFGIWRVTKVWAAPDWINGFNPAHDFALLHVTLVTSDPAADDATDDIHRITGGDLVGFELATASTEQVSVTGYAAGSHDAPITCTAATFRDKGFPGFACAGYVGGTSGAPWLEPTSTPGISEQVGLIGGLDQGGCTDDVSYSPRFGPALLAVIMRAQFQLTGDTMPDPPSDGC